MDHYESSESIGLLPEHVITTQVVAGWEREYQKVGDLGSGGFASVFEVRRRATGESLAIKVPHATNTARERFRREVSELRRLEHPNVMPILDVGEDWYAMPVADGTLANLAAELSDDERLAVVGQVARGLAWAHDHAVVHRDVTPYNILRLREGDTVRWVIGDFGLVRRPRGNSSAPRTQGRLGTEGYIAPEMNVLGAHEVDHRADVFSFGRTIAFMVTGAAPAQQADVEIPGAWAALVTVMTATARDDRCQRMDEVQTLLTDVLSRLRQERRTRWRLATRVATIGDCEIAVLEAIVSLGPGHVEHHKLQDWMGRRRELTIGLLGLRKLSFIEPVLDEGFECAVALSADGIAWVLANRRLLLATTPQEPPPAVVPSTDGDIPF